MPVEIEEGYALVLRPGEHLSRRAVSCPSGEFSVVHQHDGNVVIYRNLDQSAIWATGTNYQRSVWNPEPLATTDLDRIYGQPGRLALEENGNLVVYSADNTMRWTSGVGSYPPFGLLLHDSGRLVVMSVKGTIPWSSHYPVRHWDGWKRVSDGRRLRRGQSLRNGSLVSDSGQYTFVVGEDTAAYLCRTGGEILWAVRLGHGEGYGLTDDGRLVSRTAEGVERPADALKISDSLATELAERGAAQMLVTDDGRLAIADDAGALLWSMETPEARGAGRATAAVPQRPARRMKPRIPAGVPRLPAGEFPYDMPVIRTDFSDDAAWHDALARVSAGYAWSEGDEPLSVDVMPVDDRRYENLTPEQLAVLAPPDVDWPMLVVADAKTMAEPERHLLLVSLDEECRGPIARATAPAIVEMQINLMLGNMDWEEFVGDPDYGTYDAEAVVESSLIPATGDAEDPE